MIDLQIHTTATPHHATWEPEALVLAAKQAGLSTIAVTDHNTTASVRATLAAGAQHGVHVIPGVEIDSGFNGKLWHTLVYGVAPDDPALLALCRAVFERNAEDAARLRTALTVQGFALPSFGELGRPPNVAEVGAALARHNDLPGRQQGEDDESAGMHFILTQLQGGYNPVGVDEIIEVAHASGGVAVLAHPGRSKGIYAIPATADNIAVMAAAGLDGVEVWYPTHSAEQRQFYAALAQEHGLLITGGSDSHGPHQPLAHWSEDLCQVFLERMI
ncbi:MAG TPA: PHP domain-containing protein [Roseiflexaceae bacterium]|nr:PHP domain-containing protein [Roseiflexaceae bacterium]